jgi:hypothetical protein
MRGYLICFALLAALVWLKQDLAPVTPADQRKNIDVAQRAYERISRVKPSKVGGAEFEEIIRRRLACYEETAFPLERFRVCGASYVDAIVRTARESVKSRPELGQFIRRVQYCPIIHSICTGEHHDAESCVLMERQCIDATLDQYWRGEAAPLPRD